MVWYKYFVTLTLWSETYETFLFGNSLVVYLRFQIWQMRCKEHFCSVQRKVVRAVDSSHPTHLVRTNLTGVKPPPELRPKPKQGGLGLGQTESWISYVWSGTLMYTTYAHNAAKTWTWSRLPLAAAAQRWPCLSPMMSWTWHSVHGNMAVAPCSCHSAPLLSLAICLAVCAADMYGLVLLPVCLLLCLPAHSIHYGIL